MDPSGRGPSGSGLDGNFFFFHIFIFDDAIAKEKAIDQRGR
jgi:hypothetical protein